MIREKIENLISEATKNRNLFELETIRLVKTELMKYNTSKEAVSKPMDDNIEISILKKMVKQRKESAELYKSGNRLELAEKEIKEAEYIAQFLPKETSVDEIEEAVNSIISSGVEPVKKNMGRIIKEVKTKYPAADGKLVSQVVSSKLS